MNKKNINIIAILIGLSGICGMLYCLQFLWSNRIEDLIGAGLPFIGGTILTGAALISLSINNKL